MEGKNRYGKLKGNYTVKKFKNILSLPQIICYFVRKIYRNYRRNNFVQYC